MSAFLARAFALVCGLAAFAAQAGGPLQLCNSTPVKYPGTGTIRLNYDGGGSLGSRTKAQADAIVTNAVSLWTNVGTATVAVTRGADLPVDVTLPNYVTYFNSFNDGLNPVIYDSDGSIVDDLLGIGAKSSVLGFAGSGYSGSTCQYVEGRAVISGYIAISDATMTNVIAHEIGHLIGLDHTQLDNAQGLPSTNYPLMYPIAYRTGFSLHDDDSAAVSALYPDTTLNSVYGQVSGNLRAADGATAVLGANIWAQEVTTLKVYSIVSDYLMQSNGYFKLLLPAGTYTLHAEAIQSRFTGGSSVGPYSDIFPTSPSFQPPLFVGGAAMAPVTLGGTAPVAFQIVAGCTATATFALSGNGAVSGNCVTKANPTVSLGSSANPAAVGQAITFTATVSGSAGTATGTVDFRDGSSAVAGCTAMGVSGGRATCATSTLATGSHTITAAYSGNTAYNSATSAALTQTVQAASSNSTNFAAASAGGVATASSTYAPSYPVTALNNGERAGTGWGNGGAWLDATGGVYPDWVQINFNGSKAIDRVVVYTLQDNYGSPVDPSDTLTFTAYGVTAFTVQGWNGTQWVALGSVTGNNLVKRTVTFTAFTTDRIRIQVDNALASFSRLTEIEAFGAASSTPPAPPPPTSSTNVALASAGGVATASSTYAPAYPVTALNNGERAGTGWGNGGAWLDATGGVYPDWVQITFNGSKTIDRVVVYTLQDNYGSPVDPSDTLTFSAYGVTAFTVQGWNGTQWVALGSVTGNNLVKRTVNFTAFTTDRIRVQVDNALASFSRLTEIEAFGTSSSTPPPPAASSNVALASSGGVATASSTYAPAYPVAALNNGDRAGLGWGNGGAWLDATSGVYPDWVQINFSGSKTVDRVVVYTLQDNYGSPVDPSDTLTFSAYGVTAFTVQGWNGTQWVTLGSVTGNNLVKRTVSFTGFTTDRIRVQVDNAMASFSRLTEIEAWGS